MKTLKNLLNPHLLTALILFSVFRLITTFTPTRKEVIDYFDGNGAYLFWIENVLSFFILLPAYAFFYGWITVLILLLVRKEDEDDEKINLKNSLGNILSWFPRSIAVLTVGWCGIIVLTYLLNSLSSDFLFSFLCFLLSGMWITLTFTFYPTIIASRKTLLKSFKEALFINIRSTGRWFHWLLLVFFLSGGFVYIWIPQEIAQKYITGSWDLIGWMVHFQWLGGYSFTPHWYLDYLQSLRIYSSKVVITVLFFISAAVLTLVKIKVTRMLITDGYISGTSRKS